MAHESFENEQVAEILNRDFIAIKLDREERPDVDRIYMLYVQAVTGSGGWPLSVWLTPDLKPFYRRHVLPARLSLWPSRISRHSGAASNGLEAGSNSRRKK